MKILCIIFIVILAIVVFRALGAATSLYMGYESLNNFGVSLQQINNWELPYALSFIVYATSLGFSIYFFVKKKYSFSVVVSVIMVVVYSIGPYLGYAWLR